jgi:1-acyl-sn-glycerol-3-phosphate acyltransferase
VDGCDLGRAHAELSVSDTKPSVQGAESDPWSSALSGLREELRRRLSGNAAPAEPEAEPTGVDWVALVEDLRRRIGQLGMRERSGEVDDFGLDPETIRSARPLLQLLRRRWWRSEVVGLEHVPSDQPVLFVANHSGLLPWDGLVLAETIEEAHGPERRPRFLIADWLITLPFAQAALARIGGVRACRENAERLLATGRSVIAFPEGVKGAAKVFRERYRVKRFGRGGVVRVALETGVPLIPVAIVGAEETHPVLFKWTTPGRLLGLPFVPVTPTFPLLGPLGALPLPSKWVIRIGDPLPIDHLPADAAADELLVSRLTEELRSQVQALVDVALADRESVWG